MWQRVEKFSIRKFSFGAASCLIGAITVLGSSSQIANADGITSYEANGDKVTAYAHGESVYKLRGTSTSIYNAFRMDVDTSKYTKENPVITVTLTYNAPDNPNEKAPIFWSGRPFHWFTVPEGTEELGNDNKFSLTNANGTAEFNDWSSWGTNSRFVQGTNVTNLGPFRRKKNNDTTKEKLGIWPRESIDAEFNKVLGLNDDRWYDNSGMPTQDIMKDLRAKSQSIYLDWEKRAAETVTVTYTTKVKDPENTKELTIGMGVYQELNGQQYARVETVKLPVLYKLNELFEPKIPERTGVANPNQLSDDEVKVIKEKIWNANQDNTSTLLPADSNAFQENVKDKTENGVNSIEIDKNTGTATITYKDDTKDVIPGTSLIYQTPDAENPSQGNNGTYIYRVSPYPVGNLNNISLEEIVAGLNKFKEINGIKTDENDVITSVGDGVSTSFIGKKLSPYINKGERYGTISIIEYGKYTGVSIPKDAVFKLKPQFDVDAARAEANKVIDSLANLYPNEQTKYKNQIATATTREAIENVINTAKTTDNENAVELAKMKKEANDTINELNYLTSAEKEEAIAKINTATIKQNDDVDKVYDDTHPDTDANREATKARLTSVVDALVKKDLEAARTKAKETINGIPDKDLSSDKKTEYITAINNATKVGPVSEEGTILNIVDKAQKEAADALAKRRKEEADKVRQQYKDMIAAIPGLTEEEKKQYDEAIDNATSTDEMASIVEFAKLTGDRKTAVAEIEKLEHLNNNQKQSFKDLVENSANKEDIENYVSQAKQLNSKMKQLHDLVEKAKEIKSQEAYTSATEDKKKVFDQALSDAENVLNKETGTDESISTVENLFKKLETAINNLQPDGEKVKVDVDKSLLKEEYDKGTSVKESPLYKNSTDENGKTAQQRKDEYDKKLVAAKTILDDKDAEQTDVDNTLEDLLSAKADLNGKEAEFTLSKKDGAVPISVAPAVGVVVSKPEDQKLIKDKINGIPEGSTVIYNPIQEKGGKTVVPVKVTHENVSKEIEIEVVQSEAAKITPTVSTAKLSEVPTENGTITKAEDVQKVTEAVSVPVPEGQAQPRKDLVDNGKVVKGTDQRANGGANNTGKLVVKVEVTYQDGSKETVEVPVEGTDAAKSPLTPPTKVKVNNPNSLTEEEKTAVADAVKEANPSLKADTNITVSVDGKGKVTVTYPDQSTNTLEAEKTVEAKKDNEKSPLTEPKKVKVNDPNSLTEEEKTAVADAVKEANPSLKADTNITVSVDGKGKVTVTYPDQSTNTLEAEKTIEAKTKAEQAIPTVTAGEVPVSVDPATDKKVAEADKKAITEAVVVPEGQPQPTDKQVKNDGAIVEGTGANAGKKVVVVEVKYPDGSKDEIEVPVRKATDKEKAKADLTKAADAEKAEIDEDNALSKKEKEALKAKVDELKAKHEENINNATLPEAIASATEKGRQEIAAVHTPQDITETAKRKLTPPKEKVKVTDINHLTNEEKDAVKKAIVAANPQLEESEVYVDDQGNVASPKGYLEAEKVVTQALNKPATPVVVADPNHLSDAEKEAVKKAVADANPGLIKDDITVDDKGNVTTKNGDKLLAKDVVTPALKKPTTPVVVENPASLTDKEKENIKDAVVAENPGLNKGDVKVDNQGNVETPKGNLPKEDVVTTPLNKPNKLVEVENPNSLTVKEKEAVKKAVVEANPGLTEDKVKVDDQGNVTTPQGNLPAKDVVTSTLKKPTTPVEVVNPSKLTEPEKSKIVEEIIKNNPGLTDKDIKVDDQGNVETPKGNLPAEDVVTPALKKPTKLVPVKDVHSLTEAEKDAVKDAVVAANPGLNKDDVKVDGQGNVETPRGNLLAGEVVTPALKKPVTPVEVKDPKNLTEAEKDAVKDAVVAANPGLNKDDVKVDGQGNVETPQGNLPAKDVVTPALKKPVTPVGVKDSNNLTDKEKEDVKKAIVEANPGLNKDDVKVDDQGNVETPNGNLPKEDVVVQTAKGQSTSIFKPELDLQTALVSGKVTVEKGKGLTDEEILKQLALADGVTAKVISKPTTTETGTKEAEVEVTLADGSKVTVKVPVEVVDSLGTADKDNDLAKAKEDAKKQVEEAAKKKLEEIKNNKDLTEDQKQKAEKEINKAKEDANKAIDEASSAGTAKQIADQAKENIEKYDPKADAEVKKPDVTNLDEEKAKAKAEILEEAQKRIDEIKNNKDLSDEAKQKAIEEINKAKDKAIEDINKGQSKDEINAAKEAGIHKINEVQPEGSIASKFEPKVPENKVEVENPAKLSDEEREQVRQNIEGANTFPDGTTVEVQPDGTALITYKDGSSDTISKDKLVAPANKETGTIASRTEPVIPGKTQVGNTTKLTPEEQAAVKKAVEDANNFPAGTTVEVRPDGTVVITYPDKSVDTITGDKLVEKGSKQETPKVQTDAEKNPAQVPGNFVPVENTHNLTQTEQDTVAAKVKEANPAATDVKVSKDGTATLTYGDGSVNTIPGTSLVVAKDTDNEASTQAAQNPAVVPATTEVGNAHSLTPEEQAEVAAKVQATNPAATDVKVSKNGTATLTYGDGSVNTIPGTSLVAQKEGTSTQEQPTIAEKTKVIIPANPTKVAEATRLTDEEKEAVKKAVVDANGFGSDVKVEVAGDGTATIVFKDGSAITIPGNQLVAQDPKAQDSTKTTAEKSTVKAPAQRVDVKDITHLTDEEKEKVKVAILQANGSALDGATINVAGDGTATITFPDGSVVTILGKDTVQQSAKGESVTQEATPEYKPETTPGGDNGGNTGSSDANAGGGSQAGGQAHTGSQTPAQSQASKQLATEKESAKNAIEKAVKDKQDEIKGAPLSDKEKAELLARVEAEKQAALKEIENAKTVEDVKEAETIGVQAIAMVTVPKRPVAPNAAPQATSAPQATAGTMQDVTYQSPAGKQLPNTGSASSAALASLGLVAATSGFALLGRKARRRK